MESLKQRVLHLQHGPFARVLGVVLSVRQSIRYREKQQVFMDEDGDWINVQPRVSVASPEVSLVQFSEVEADVRDLWCYAYTPRSGDVVVDLGAGIGDDVVAFSRLVGPTGRVIAVEAHPRTFRCLRKTVVLNRLDNVIVLNEAVASAEAVVHISDGPNHVSNFVSAATASSGGLAVRARPLDAVLAEIGCQAPALIKMNIEGAELDALGGMSETLRLARNLVVSCHDFLTPTPGSPPVKTFEGVKALLAGSGYSLGERPRDSRSWVRYYVYAGRSPAMTQSLR